MDDMDICVYPAITRNDFFFAVPVSVSLGLYTKLCSILYAPKAIGIIYTSIHTAHSYKCSDFSSLHFFFSVDRNADHADSVRYIHIIYSAEYIFVGRFRRELVIGPFQCIGTWQCHHAIYPFGWRFFVSSVHCTYTAHNAFAPSHAHSITTITRIITTIITQLPSPQTHTHTQCTAAHISLHFAQSFLHLYGTSGFSGQKNHRAARESEQKQSNQHTDASRLMQTNQ